MYSTEAVFEEEVIKVLKKDHSDIETQYRPFSDLSYSVDIKSIFKDIEEWRELKIIFYKDKGRSIQNLWKGFGKVILMQDLVNKIIEKKTISVNNILTLPEYDLNKIPEKVINSMVSIINIEKLVDEDIKYLAKVGE